MKNRWKIFLSNALILSVVNIVMRAIGVSFNAYITNKIGAESMGLFTLVMSVYGFAVTVALSCVNLGAVRLTSERSALLEGCDKESWKKSMRQVIRSVVIYSTIFGVTTGIILFISADFLALRVLSDTRTASSLKVLALSLPAISISSGISGYFTGLRKVTKNAIVSVSEQFIKIIVTSTALVLIVPGNVESACLAVVGGSAIAEAWSLIVNLLMYLTDSGRPVGVILGKAKKILKTKLKDTVDISLPSAVGTYARQGLTTLEHLAIPKGMQRGGIPKETALAHYGLMQGIAFPIVMFPYSVIGSFTALLVPEIAGNRELNNTKGIREITEDVYKYSAIFSMCVCGIFANFSSELGSMVFKSTEASTYTFLLGLLVPFMYLDTAVDSLLKGMGEQVYTMKVNIFDSASGLMLVMITTPLLGIYGYILTICLCEIGNLTASIYKLGKVTGVGAKIAVKYYISPLISVVIMSIINVLIVKFNPISRIVIYVAGYTLLYNVITRKKIENKY
ncbi:MAG: hypothetical protein E7627_00070 [Ruminococcaceae bacterium]|nr:hypothetical protein [Oscillospiraceae bacterium]